MPQAQKPGEREAEAQRKIQRAGDARAQRAKSPEKRPMQTGARRYPTPPLPEQHQPKPGDEAALDPAPLFDAPYYKGSGKLEGMAAIVTGGDSGIGRAVSVLFAREGADVAIVYLSEHADAEATAEAVRAEGARALLISGDVTDAQFCRDAVEQSVEAFGRLDVLVNNAAFQLHVERFEDLTEEQFDKTLKTNLYGYFHMCQAALPHLKEGASIINTGSVTAMRGSKALIDYSMTKGGIHTFSMSLAAHLAPRGVRVNVVAPGPVWTPLNPADQAPDKVAHFGEQTLMGRPAQPEEIAPAFVFLASPQTGSYLTGEILALTGGEA